MALKPHMDIKPGRSIRVGTTMMKSGAHGEVKQPTIPQYAEELEQLSENARKVAAGDAEAYEVEQSAALPEVQAAAFDHDGDGRVGGAPKGGNKRKS